MQKPPINNKGQNINKIAHLTKLAQNIIKLKNPSNQSDKNSNSNLHSRNSNETKIPESFRKRSGSRGGGPIVIRKD